MSQNSVMLSSGVILLALLLFSPGCSHDEPAVIITPSVKVIQVQTGHIVEEKHNEWWLVSPELMLKLYALAREGDLAEDMREIGDVPE